VETADDADGADEPQPTQIRTHQLFICVNLRHLRFNVLNPVNQAFNLVNPVKALFQPGSGNAGRFI
jgi:hypothetical protein